MSMIRALIFSFLAIILLILPTMVNAEEHTIERGETALQIAIDHNLTMDQLAQLNPGINLEMMLIGDTLIVPDEGTSFEAFLAANYSKLIQITDLHCETLLDRSALCLFHAENLSRLPLYDVHLKAALRGQNGVTAQTESAIPTMQILPGEKLPVSMIIPGKFDAVEESVISVQNLSYSDLLQSSFRISPELYTQSDTVLPDGVASTSTIRFNEPGSAVYHEKHINILAAAYDEEGSLVGVRSLYTDYYPRLDITVYANNHRIKSVELRLEAY